LQQLQIFVFLSHFYILTLSTTRRYASAVYAVVVCLSVCYKSEFC